jgi:hypothetical protein
LADDLFGGLEAKSISLKPLRLRGDQCDVRFGVRERSRIVFPTKGALACPERLLTGSPARLQFYSNSATVALAEVSHLTFAFVLEITARRHMLPQDRAEKQEPSNSLISTLRGPKVARREPAATPSRTTARGPIRDVVMNLRSGSGSGRRSARDWDTDCQSLTIRIL